MKKRTIDISLQYDDTNITARQENTSGRTVNVCLTKKGLATSVDGSNRSITVSFGALPTDVHWNDILDKPDMAEPMYWEEM